MKISADIDPATRHSNFPGSARALACSGWRLANRIFWAHKMPSARAPMATRGGACAPRKVCIAVQTNLVALLLLLPIMRCVVQSALADNDHWLVTWACAPQLTEPRNLPPQPLANCTLRQFVHVTVGGKSLRLHLSNQYGTNAVKIASVHIATPGAESAQDGAIVPATDKPLTFRGAPSISIPLGKEIVSDPIAFDLPPLANLAISIHFGDIPAATVTGHPGSRTTSFIVPGDSVSAASLPAAARTAHWYIIARLEVMADEKAKAIVVLGDSITDGRGSTTDGNDRWPDDLARRLATNRPTGDVAIANLGIGGNGIFGGLGPSALARFDRDVLDQSGAGWLIILEGVNDLGNGGHSAEKATNLIAAYTKFTAKARARGMKVYGATITPFGGNGYYSTAHEAARQVVNTWIRTNHVYDAVLDFDAVVRDPEAPTKLLRKYDTGDGLHPNAAGYQAMADSVDLALFGNRSK